MKFRRTLYKVPILITHTEFEAYFTTANKWKGSELSKSRIGSALRVAGVTEDTIEHIFDAGATAWKTVGGADELTANLDFRCKTVEDLRQNVEDRLREEFHDVFEKDCDGEEQMCFHRERVVDMIVYRTWHDWSRKIRRQNEKLAGGNVRISRRKSDGIDVFDGNGGSPGTESTDTDTLSVSGTPTKSNINTKAFTNACKKSPGNSASPAFDLDDQWILIEVNSLEDNDQLLRVYLKCVSLNGENETDPNSALRPSFAKLEAEVRKHPFITVPETLLFVHVYDTDQTAFVFSQATLETAFVEWKASADFGATRTFQLCIGDVREREISQE